MISPKPASTVKSTNKRNKPRKKASNRRQPRVIEHPRSSADLFTNREIGWLHFNARVLNQAQDERTPLLERIRFLSISDTNLDEFFMKRVGGLLRQVVAGISSKSADGKTPQEQLTAIRNFVVPFMESQAECYYFLKDKLAQNNVALLKWFELTEDEHQALREYYKKNIFPVLTPLSVDPGHPFPFISNLSVSLGVTLKAPDSEEKHFARIKIPKNKNGLPQWIRIPNEGSAHRYVSMIDVIRENLHDLFPSMQVLDAMPFRVTRNADFDAVDDEAEDLLKMITEELRQRRFAEVVRLEHGPDPDPWMLQFLKDELELLDENIYEHPGELDYSDLLVIADQDLPHLQFKPHVPSIPLAFTDESISIFSTLKMQDQLIHCPYESYSATVERFIREASVDPKVLAIKMTLYRTGDNSPFVRSLIRAAESGKQVVCLVELKARFDEERNIYWAQALENAGVHVVYGVVGLKTHAKTSLVVRQEAEGIQCYAHIGTGNYNVATSRFYTDMGLLTSRSEITSELVEFFNYLTGRSLKKNYEHLLVAPVNMYQRFLSMIGREAENAKAGKPSGIIAKFNNMEENDIALALYDASKAGVSIDLLVRGFCCVRPGVKGLSENLRVISHIGRFLEHSRIFYFRNGASDPVDGEFYIGSADWMYRNLHARVEAIVPIYDRSLKEKIWEVLQLSISDQRLAWDMKSDGTYEQRRKENEVGLHEQLAQIIKRRNTPEEMPEQKGMPVIYGSVSRQTRDRRRAGRVSKKEQRRSLATVDTKRTKKNAKGSDPGEGSNRGN